MIPVRASPGLAIRFFCFKWNLEPQRLLVAGDSGNDWDMLSGDTLGVGHQRVVRAAESCDAQVGPFRPPASRGKHWAWVR